MIYSSTNRKGCDLIKKSEAPLGEKEYLYYEEAVLYWNLSRRKLLAFLKDGPHSFVVPFGNRRLILRVQFERYMKEHPKVKEALASGKPRKKRQ